MKNVYTISSALPFAQTLAQELLEQYKDNPLELSKTVIFLPTRRACKTMQEAFLQQSNGEPLMLPRLIPFGTIQSEDVQTHFSLLNEISDIPPAMSGLRRQLLLSHLIQKSHSDDLSAEKALSLATSLAAFLDESHIEQVPLDGLKNLVPDEFATHWQKTLEFLEIITEFWPKILEDEAVIDNADRQIRLFKAQTDYWKENPPNFPIIAAGSTGSQPATALFLDTIASLKQGMVILPGLDTLLDEESFQAVEPSHPQYHLKSLLEKMNISRAEVHSFGRNLDDNEQERLQLISDVMRPATTTDKWLENTNIKQEQTIVNGVEQILCATKQQEALTIALLLRKTLEDKTKTAALITPDRELANRVIAEMNRWNIVLDDSAGKKFTLTTLGSFLLLVAKGVLENWKSLHFLECLKHPLALGGQSFSDFRPLVRRFERFGLRGQSLSSGLDGLVKQAKKADEKVENNGVLLTPFILDFKNRVDTFTQLMTSDEKHTLTTFIDAHIEACENLAQSNDKEGTERLWVKEAGKAGSDFFTQLKQESDILEEISPFEYLALISSLLNKITVRPKYGMHPRLDILGTMEARLIQADTVILSGLNEGVWPKNVDTGPWLSRPMREKCGLPSPERKIALSAHDFVQAFCSKNVILTRSLKEDGTPTVPCRWLLRLETVLKIQNKIIKTNSAKDWAEQLDLPNTTVSFLPPCPKPPFKARLKHFSVTGIERLMRDPYAVYASKILKLNPIDDFIEGLTPADFGNIVHKTIETFFKNNANNIPDNALDEMIKNSDGLLSDLNLSETETIFVKSRLKRTFIWFLKQQEKRQPLIEKTYCEEKFLMEFKTDKDTYSLLCYADRIDVLKDKTAVIIDYKTGSNVPSLKQVDAGFAPQLPLEAKLLSETALNKLNVKIIKGAEYWRIKPENESAKITVLKTDINELSEKYFDDLQEIIKFYENENNGYAAMPDTSFKLEYNDYEHLARHKEWAVFDTEEDNEE